MSKRAQQQAGMDDYRAKRDFRKTPEPPPATTRRPLNPLVFVIHRHEARRLHYDLRLAMDGVLKSWAVPKGFSYDPGEKRLAIHTEDHPLAYEDFDGVIPAGQYGAGTMTIWDRGRYELTGAGDPLAALAAGKLELRLFGGRLRGEWHMVKLKKAGNEWLLFKSRDRYARDKDAPVFSLDLSRTAPRPMPRRVRRMMIGKVAEPFQEPGWLFELKLAGLRVLVERRGDNILFRGTRRRLGSRLQPLTNDLLRLKAENALLDGVLVCLDDNQRPSKSLLERVLAGEIERPVEYYAFDLLYYEEWDLRSIPLIERKAALAAILPASGRVIFVQHEQSRGEQLRRTIAAAGLAGCVAKRADSSYVGGPSQNWLEIPAQIDRKVKRGGSFGTTKRSAAGAAPVSHSAGSPIRLTNQHKVFWPREGYTKGDLIRYYDDVADYLLPYLQDRPLSLHRFPDGIESESFFQKNVPPSLPKWVPTASVSGGSEEKATRFVICNDRTTLLYLANLACIELHPWSSRLGSLDWPDWAILDLDPSTSDFEKVRRIARSLGKLLRGIGLRPCLKTSGAKGLHIYIALRPGYSYDQARMFCEGIARFTAHRLKEIATVDRVKQRRQGKVYIDFLQNRRGQTIVAPYVVRPVPGATVSTPLEWDELSSDMHPSQFTIESMISRLASQGDLFRQALNDPQDLLPAIEAFQQLAASA